MRPTKKILLGILTVTATLGVLVKCSMRGSASDAAPKDGVKIESIENNEIFRAIGVYAWKVRTPPGSLNGKKEVKLYATLNGNDKAVATCKFALANTQIENLKTITAIIHIDPNTYAETKRINMTLICGSSKTGMRIISNVETIEGTIVSNDVDSIGEGSELLKINSPENKASMEFHIIIE